MTTVAIGGSGYVTSFLRDFGLEIPARFSVAPLAYDPAVGTWSPTGALVNLPAIFIIILITILLVVGIRESAKVNNVIVAIKLVIIVVFILAGVWFVKASNWVTPSNPTGAFIPPNIGTASVRGDRSSKISHALYHDADHRRDRRDR